jgi:hypothetical protein
VIVDRGSVDCGETADYKKPAPENEGGFGVGWLMGAASVATLHASCLAGAAYDRLTVGDGSPVPLTIPMWCRAPN